MELFYPSLFSLLLVVFFSALAGALAVVQLLYLPERKKFLKLLSDMQRTAAEQLLKIETLQRRSFHPMNTSGSLNLETQEEFNEYKRNGGRLDLLSWLLAKDDHLRFP